jgi:hypothetical protein
MKQEAKSTQNSYGQAAEVAVLGTVVNNPHLSTRQTAKYPEIFKTNVDHILKVSPILRIVIQASGTILSMDIVTILLMKLRGRVSK